jgi:hypothetical protein
VKISNNEGNLKPEIRKQSRKIFSDIYMSENSGAPGRAGITRWVFRLEVRIPARREKCEVRIPASREQLSLRRDNGIDGIRRS